MPAQHPDRRGFRVDDADNDDDQDDEDEYTATAAQTTPQQRQTRVPSPAGSHITARTRTRTTTVVTTTPTRSSSSTGDSSSPPLRRSSRGPRGELHTPPVLLPTLSFNSTAGAASSSSSSPVTTATGSTARYSWQQQGGGAGGGRAQSPSTPPPPSPSPTQQQRHHRPARDSSYADGDGSASGPSTRDRDRDTDRNRDERTASPSSHPLAYTNSTDSTDSTFSSASSSSSASASASASDNDWARSWIDSDHDHDLGRAYEQQRGFHSNSALAAPLFDAPPGARADTTTTAWSRPSGRDPGGGDLAEKEEGEEEEEEGEEGRKRLELGEVQEGAGAREQQARTAEAVKGNTPGTQKQEEEEQEQELGRLLRGNHDAAEEEEEEREEDLADLTSMIGGGFGSPPPPSSSTPPSATWSDADAQPRATAPPTSRPATTTTVVLPTIEPLFSQRTGRPTSPAPAPAPAVIDESESNSTAGRGAVQSRPEASAAAPPPPSRPLSEFDWAAAYADGEGGGAGGAAAACATLPSAAAAGAKSADRAPERKVTQVSLNPAAATTAVSSTLDLEPTTTTTTTPPPLGVNAIRDEAAPSVPLPPQQQQQEEEQEQDPMAMLDSLIYQSSSASEPEPMESTTAPTAHSTRPSRDESSPSSPSVPSPILLPGSVVAATPLPSVQSPTSPAATANANASANGNGNGRKERGPAPVIPVKSSRRASLLGRRRQSADSQTLLQRAASMARATATSPRSAVGGAAMTSDPSSSSSSSLNEEGGRVPIGSRPPSHARSGSVPVSASATRPGPASGLSSPSAGGGAATSPTLSRSNSSGYDFAEIADVYARNSLYYPPPDATPRASRAWEESEEVPRPTSASFEKDEEEEETGSGTNTARQSRIEEQLEPTSAVEPPVAQRPSTMTPSRSSTDVSSRADAKARAAAFIADLKRAKMNEATPAPGAPVIAAGFETARSPHLDGYSFPADGGSIASARSYSMPAETSPDTTPPPLPPPSSSKRPLENVSTSSFGSRRLSYHETSRSTTNLALLSSSGHPYEHAQQPLLDQRPPLLRRRALPTAVIISAELKKAATSRERCRLYVDKLNELGRERSRLDEWILATKGDHRTPAMSAANAPNRSRWARQDASVATFAPRGDGYRAREITRGSFSAHDLAPSAPFPVVLNLTPTRSISHASLASGGGGGGKSFFSGLGRGTLGRRMSKRDHAGPSSSRSSANKSSSLRSTISGPVQVLSSTNAALAPISDGPYRPPAHQAAYTRNSFDSRRSSPATSPHASRASFSYGSLPPSASSVSSSTTAAAAAPPAIPTFQVTRGSVYYENGEKTAGSQVGDLDEEKLDRLADVLPQASRADLAAALEEAGGDDVLAISVYLSSEPSLT